ncbi:MAG: DUF262 domain-containing protein [candidate division Zixibacteria bacterium]|nr:DUF262 domain-containing protein [candidate division Zixibacteria bacterium]
MIEEIDEQLEEQFVQTDEESLLFKYSITSYGADYPVDGLVKRIKNQSIFVPPFQRNYVWSHKMASRFIESLLLGLPVPGIFLSKEEDSRKLKVIDGQQRLRTLQFFYDGVFEPNKIKFELADVNEQFCGVTYDSLSDEDRRNLDDCIIHAIVIKQDQPSSDESSVYEIFERLNTGGQKLYPQEIRSCIYHGLFNDMLNRLNENSQWREIFGKPSKRRRDQELLLRFFALHFNGDEYKKPMKDFLNNFMAKNKAISDDDAQDFENTFNYAIDIVFNAIGSKAFRPNRPINAAVFDSVMIGIAIRLEHGGITKIETVKEKYDLLLQDIDYQKTIETATTDEEAVKKRISSAINYFKDVE